MIAKEKLKTLPNLPGIYVMKDSLGNIIYVGKSKNLKNRVGQYFIKNISRTPKVEKLVKNIKDFDFFVTETELEALLLECRLIKELKPPYNRQLKNSEGYPYIKVVVTDIFSKICLTDNIEEDNELYFGPFNSLSRVEEAVCFIKRLYPIRKCLSFPKGNKSCLEYHLGSCMAPCINKKASDLYGSYIKEIICFLKGEDKNLILKAKKQMEQASANLDFEKAAFYRDGLASLNYISNCTKSLKAANKKRNMVVIEKLDNGIVKYFIIRGRDIVYSEAIEKAYLIKHLERNLPLLDFNEENEANSKEEIDFYSIIYSYLKRNKDRIVSMQIPKNITTSFYLKLEKCIEKI